MQKPSPKSQWIWYSIGVALITVLYYVFIGRFPGYIYYWDASGAFSSRDPWEQYVTTYSPYDGVEVGLKNRLPIVSFIAIITQLLRVFGGNEGELAMKVAMWLVFILGFTSFYWLYPKFINFFADKNKQVVESQSGILSLLLAFLYLLMPFFVYRLVHLHLFYFTAFYPLFCYFFLQLLEDKKNWRQPALGLILTSFFGFTTPHTIVYVALTYLILFVFWLFGQNIKSILHKVGQLAVTAFGIVGVNLYWLVPYILEKSPPPGYMVNTDMYTFLGANTSALNFLFDIGEWFVAKEGAMSGFFAQGSILRSLQYVGVFFFYALVMYFLVKKGMQKYSIAIVTLLLICMLFAVKESPLQSYITNDLVFSSFGWVIREPNRIRFIFTFWTFLMFSLGFTSYFRNLQNERNVAARALSILVFSAGLTAFILYLTPRFVLFANFLKPTQFPETVQRVQKELAKEQTWGNLLFYPREEGGYGLSWKNTGFALADENDFLSLSYQLKVPPTRDSSALASSRDAQDVIGSRFIEGKLNVTQDIFRSQKIQYILVDKAPRPLYEWIPDISASIATNNKELKLHSWLTLMHENDQYSLFKVKNFADLVTYSRRIYTADDLTILEHIELTKNVEVEFVNRADAKFPIGQGNIILSYKDTPFPYLDYLQPEVREKYSFDVAKNVKEYGLGKDWARMSLSDRVNGMASVIFSTYDLNVLDFYSGDVVIYSDKSALIEQSVAPLTLEKKVSCKAEKCKIFAKLLYSPKGGEINLRVGNNSNEFDTNRDEERYLWQDLGEITYEGNLSIVIDSVKGFQSIADIIVIPASVEEDTRIFYQSNEIISIDRASTKKELIGATSTLCLSTEKESKIGFITAYDIQFLCNEPRYLSFGVWKGTSGVYFDNATKRLSVIDLTKGYTAIDGTIYLITFSTIILWALLVPTYVVVVVLLFTLRKRKHLT